MVDAVKSHTQVQSKSETGEANKLSHQEQGPLQVKIVLGKYSYGVQQYNEPVSAMQKYKSTNLYLISLAILPHKPVDTTYVCFLNHSQAPLVSPLHKSMK